MSTIKKKRHRKSGLLEMEAKLAIVRWIKSSVEEAGITQYRLEKMAGLNKGDLTRVLRDPARQPGWYIVCRLSAALNKDIPTPSFSKDALAELSQ